MKKFITTAPFQEKLDKLVYDSGENGSLAYGRETSFPITHVIANSARSGEEIEVVTVVAEYEFAERNEKLFERELEALAAEKGFSYRINTVATSFEESAEKSVSLFGSLIEQIGDGDILSACITYGSKLMPLVVMMALSCGYKLKKDVVINKLVYGEVDRKKGTARIHDATSLFYMNSAVFNLSQSGVSDPLEIIRYMLNA